MIIALSSDEIARLTDLDRLDRLHAELHGSLATAMLGDLCQPGDDDHIWLDVSAARTIGIAQSADGTFGTQFDAMIVYAESKGWMNAAGTHVRAHIERVD